MRKIKKNKHSIDQIGDYSDEILNKIKRYKKISCLYYFLDRETQVGLGCSLFNNTEEFCEMMARTILDNAESLKMDPLDLIFMIKEKTEEDHERPEKIIERNVANKKNPFVFKDNWII